MKPAKLRQAAINRVVQRVMFVMAVLQVVVMLLLYGRGTNFP